MWHFRIEILCVKIYVWQIDHLVWIVNKTIIIIINPRRMRSDTCAKSLRIIYCAMSCRSYLIVPSFQRVSLPCHRQTDRQTDRQTGTDVLRGYCSVIPRTFSTAEPSKGRKKANRLNATWNTTRCSVYISLRLLPRIVRIFPVTRN